MELIKEKDPDAMVYHISRDEIRFSLLEKGDEYFAKENRVKKTFFDRILFCFLNWEHCYVFADATFLSKKARLSFINYLKNLLPDMPKVCAISFNVSSETCLSQNNLRTGRERVPEEAVLNMWSKYSPPTMKEYPYERILVIKDE